MGNDAPAKFLPHLPAIDQSSHQQSGIAKRCARAEPQAIARGVSSERVHYQMFCGAEPIGSERPRSPNSDRIQAATQQSSPALTDDVVQNAPDGNQLALFGVRISYRPPCDHLDDQWR